MAGLLPPVRLRSAMVAILNLALMEMVEMAILAWIRIRAVPMTILALTG